MKRTQIPHLQLALSSSRGSSCYNVPVRALWYTQPPELRRHVHLQKHLRVYHGKQAVWFLHSREVTIRKSGRRYETATRQLQARRGRKKDKQN